MPLNTTKLVNLVSFMREGELNLFFRSACVRFGSTTGAAGEPCTALRVYLCVVYAVYS